MYVQLHIPAGTPEQQVEAEQLEDLLLSKLPQQTLQGFDGNEVRPEAWVLYFESGSPLKLLARVAEILQTAGKELSGFQAVIIDSGEREADGVRVSLFELPERLPRRKRQRKPKVFDYFAVPLPDGRFGHVQYCAYTEPAGDFVVALDVVKERPAALEILIAAPIKFGPVWMSVPLAVRDGKWQYLGNTPRECPPPVLRKSDRAWVTKQPGRYTDWTIRNWVTDEIQWVNTLSTEQRHLEFGYPIQAGELAARIATGVDQWSECY